MTPPTNPAPRLVGRQDRLGGGKHEQGRERDGRAAEQVLHRRRSRAHDLGQPDRDEADERTRDDHPAHRRQRHACPERLRPLQEGDVGDRGEPREDRGREVEEQRRVPVDGGQRDGVGRGRADELVGDEARHAHRDERRDHEHDPAEAAEDHLEREHDRGELREERGRDPGRDAGNDERLDERRRPAETGRDGRGEMGADHGRRGIGAERHPESDPRGGAADRDRGVVTVQPAFVLDDAIDDVRKRTERLGPHEPDDHRHDDAGSRDDRDQGPGTEWGERIGDPIEDHAMDEPERLVEQPHANGRRHAQDRGGHSEADVGRPRRSVHR